MFIDDKMIERTVKFLEMYKGCSTRQVLENPKWRLAKDVKAGHYDDMCETDYDRVVMRTDEVAELWNNRGEATVEELIKFGLDSRWDKFEEDSDDEGASEEPDFQYTPFKIQEDLAALAEDDILDERVDDDSPLAEEDVDNLVDSLRDMRQVYSDDVFADDEPSDEQELQL